MAPGDDEDDGRVLSPEELDISDDEHVAEIEEGRYVVSPHDPIGDVDGIESASAASESPASSHDDPLEPAEGSAGQPVRSREDGPTKSESETRATRVTEREVERWLEDSLRGADSRYGFHVTATFDGRVSQRRMMSNDVVTIFESLVLWYAQHIDSETPVEEILGILLTEANVPIRYPTERLLHLVRTLDLEPEDSIGELLERIDDRGFEL